MAHIIIWNTFNSTTNDRGQTNPTPTGAYRACGPHSMSSWMAQFGYTIKVIDFCHLMAPEDLIAITKRHINNETVAIGCSSTFWKNFYKEPTRYEEPDWIVSPRKKLQKEFKNLDWLLGGQIESFTSRMWQFKWVRFAGYSESTLLKYLDTKFGEDIPRPPFDIAKLGNHYRPDAGIKSFEVLPIQLNRGCIFKCAFCRAPLLGKKKDEYLRNLELVEQELIYNYETFGVTRYYFTDDTVNETQEKVAALAAMAERLPFRLEWVGYLRVDLIASYPDTIDLLRRSGLRGCFFGIETFNPTSAMMIGKGWNGKKAKDFLIELKKAWGTDVAFSLSLIVGFPDDTPEFLDETQKWLIESEMHAWIWQPLYLSSIPTLVDKSKFEQDAEKYGYTFPDKERQHFKWTNKNWTNLTAITKANELTYEKYPYEKIAGWKLAEFAGAMESSMDDIIFKLTPDLDEIDLWPTVRRHIADYVKFQLEYEIEL